MRRLVIGFAVLLAALTPACTGDGLTGINGIVGTWDLATLGGVPLPDISYWNGRKEEMLSDRIVMSPNGDFTETIDYRSTTAAGEVTNISESYEGTFTVDGRLVRLVWRGGTSGIGRLIGNTLTLPYPENPNVRTYVYVRR